MTNPAPQAPAKHSARCEPLRGGLARESLMSAGETAIDRPRPLMAGALVPRFGWMASASPGRRAVQSCSMVRAPNTEAPRKSPRQVCYRSRRVRWRAVTRLRGSPWRIGRLGSARSAKRRTALGISASSTARTGPRYRARYYDPVRSRLPYPQKQVKDSREHAADESAQVLLDISIESSLVHDRGCDLDGEHGGAVLGGQRPDAGAEGGGLPDESRQMRE